MTTTLDPAPRAETAPRPAPTRTDDLARRGLMLVLSSPSGAGKTTLSRRLMEHDHDLSMSVSVTTRPRRPSEIDGKDYLFVDVETYRRMAERGDLLEHAHVFGNYYGTPRRPVEKALADGKDVLFDIDWQGTKQIAEAARDDLVSIFILPPSAKALETRLRTRAQDSDDVIRGRMAKASEEISHYGEYDYVVVNADLQESFRELVAILNAERLKRRRRTELDSFVERLRAEL